MKHTQLISLAILAITMIYGCAYDNLQDLKGITDTGSCDTTAISFASQVQPIMNINCISCHNPSNANAGVILTNYSGVVSATAGGKLVGTLKGQGYQQMPPSGKLPSCDIQKIESWVNAGKPNN